MLATTLGLTACSLHGVEPSPVTVDDGTAEDVPGIAARAPITRADFTASDGDTAGYLVAEPPGASPEHPTGVVLVFHGDGASELDPDDDPGFLAGGTGIVAQGTARGYLVVAVSTPDHDSDVWWGDRGAENALFVHEFLGELEASYPIDTDDIWLVGYSGGAQFVTQNLLPEVADDIGGGGAVLFGGGGPPTDDTVDFPEPMRAEFPMFWYAGQDDLGSPDGDPYSGLVEAEAGSVWYTGAGFPTGTSFPVGIGHDLSGRFGVVLGERLDAAAS